MQVKELPQQQKQAATISSDIIYADLVTAIDTLEDILNSSNGEEFIETLKQFKQQAKLETF